MNTRRLAFPAAVLAALIAVPALAFQETKPPVAKEAKPAAATKETARMQLALPVTGLTRENTAQVKAALKELNASIYECPECGMTAAKAGECSHCEQPLAQKTRALFEAPAPMIEKNTIALDLGPGLSARLTQIDKALGASKVQIDRKTLPLQGPIALVYRGGSKEQAAKLQEAFVAGKLADAKATFDADSKEIHVRLQTGSTTWEHASAFGAKLDTPLTLADAIWTAARPHS